MLYWLVLQCRHCTVLDSIKVKKQKKLKLWPLYLSILCNTRYQMCALSCTFPNWFLQRHQFCVVFCSCPNLKHLSFHGSFHASEEAIFNVFRSCRELELIDFSNTPYCYTSILQELSCCCTKIRGVRKQDVLETNFAYDLTKWFPRLRLLNVSYSTIVDLDMFTIVTKCKELQYLDVTGCQQLIRYMDIVKIASKRIPEIQYDWAFG